VFVGAGALVSGLNWANLGRLSKLLAVAFGQCLLERQVLLGNRHQEFNFQETGCSSSKDD